MNSKVVWMFMTMIFTLIFCGMDPVSAHNRKWDEDISDHNRGHRSKIYTELETLYEASLPISSLRDLMFTMDMKQSGILNWREKNTALSWNWKGKCIQNDVARTSNDARLTLLRESRAAEISHVEEDMGPLFQQENVEEEESDKNHILDLYSLTANYVLDEAHTVSSTRWENHYFDTSTSIRTSNSPKNPEFNGIQGDSLMIIVKKDTVSIIARVIEEGTCAEEEPCVSMCSFWGPRPQKKQEEAYEFGQEEEEAYEFELVSPHPPSIYAHVILNRGLVNDVLQLMELGHSIAEILESFWNGKYKDHKEDYSRRGKLIRLTNSVFLLKSWGHSEQYIANNVGRGE